MAAGGRWERTIPWGQLLLQESLRAWLPPFRGPGPLWGTGETQTKTNATECASTTCTHMLGCSGGSGTNPSPPVHFPSRSDDWQVTNVDQGLSNSWARRKDFFLSVRMLLEKREKSVGKTDWEKVMWGQLNAAPSSGGAGLIVLLGWQGDST
jgi:hypothetical protein